MNAVDRYELRAAEYRARADDDAAKGRASPLESVRQKHEQAARTWAELADAEEQRAAQSKLIRMAHQPS
jgi:hypothetical protein